MNTDRKLALMWRWLIKWLTAKGKSIPSQQPQQRLLNSDEDEREYFKNLDKLKDAVWTAWSVLKTLEEIGGSDAASHIKSLYALFTTKETLRNLRSMGVGNGIFYRHNYDSKEAAEQLSLFRQQLNGSDAFVRAIRLADLGTNETEIKKIEKKILQMAADEAANPAPACRCERRN